MTTGAPPPPGGSCWDCRGAWAWCGVLLIHEGRVLPLVSIVVFRVGGGWVEGTQAGGGIGGWGCTLLLLLVAGANDRAR